MINQIVLRCYTQNVDLFFGNNNFEYPMDEMICSAIFWNQSVIVSPELSAVCPNGFEDPFIEKEFVKHHHSSSTRTYFFHVYLAKPNGISRCKPKYFASFIAPEGYLTMTVGNLSSKSESDVC